MLQDISTNTSESGDKRAEAAKKVLLVVSRLQDNLMGKGVFRRFLEDRMAVESEAEMACSSPAFVAAASLLIRSFLDHISIRPLSKAHRPSSLHYF